MSKSDDILIGMKQICDHLGLREERVRDIMRRDAAFPARKEGVWLSSRRALNEWLYEKVRG